MAQWNVNGATVSIHEEEWAAWARVVRGCTFASTLNLPAAEQSVVYQVRETTVQVHRRQATFKALPRGYQFGQAVVHVGAQTSNKKIAWGERNSLGHKRNTPCRHFKKKWSKSAVWITALAVGDVSPKVTSISMQRNFPIFRIVSCTQ